MMKNEFLIFSGLLLFSTMIVQIALWLGLGAVMQLEITFFNQPQIFPLFGLNVFLSLFGVFVVYLVRVIRFNFRLKLLNLLFLFVNLSLYFAAFWMVFSYMDVQRDAGWTVYPPLNGKEVDTMKILQNWYAWKQFLLHSAYIAQVSLLVGLVYGSFMTGKRWN